MEVLLTPDQQAFARQAIQSGRLHGETEVIEEALALWESRERTRSQILTAVDHAEASLAQGAGRVIDEAAMSNLARDVKQRGRARLQAEQARV